MKKLLNNRYAVIALAIGMAGFWWYQLNAIFAPGGAATSLFPSGTDAVDNDIAYNIYKIHTAYDPKQKCYAYAKP